MEVFANQYWKSAPNYQVGDKVWILTKNIRTKRNCRKLDYKQIGPYPILCKIGYTSYEVNIPNTKIHNMFHSSLLRLNPNNPLLEQIPKPFGHDVIDGEEEYEVTKILDSRLHYGKL